MRFMETAVRFEKERNAVRVSYQSSVNGVGGIELHTILKAMDVSSIYMHCSFNSIKLEFVELFHSYL